MRSDGGLSGAETEIEEYADLTHPFRKNAPIRRAYTKGSSVGLDAVGGDRQAWAVLRSRMFAKTSQRSRKTLAAWWPAMARPRVET